MGGLGVGICVWSWGDGSYVGNMIGWVALLWGLMFLSWGLTITWLGNSFAGLLGAGAGTASSLLAVLRGMRHPEWSALTGPCVLAGAIAGAVGLVSFGVGRYRARKAADRARRDAAAGDRPTRP